MSTVQKRRSVSVSAVIIKRLREKSKETGLALAKIVEQALDLYWDREEPPKEEEIAPSKDRPSLLPAYYVNVDLVPLQGATPKEAEDEITALCQELQKKKRIRSFLVLSADPEG